MSKTFIIAEAGVNHNGSLETAMAMIDAAASCCVDAVKFQTFISEKCISVSAQKANYQKEQTGNDENQLEMVKKLELSFDEFKILKKHCEEKNIIFLSTPFDLDSADFLNQLDMLYFKIPSGEITNFPLICKIGSFQKKVILSTGMSNLEEINDCIRVLKNQGANDIVLLHCNTQYPTPFQDVNLKAMNLLKETFHFPIGYSDHTTGIEIPIAAVALGATVIEKHFTLDRNMEGPDHKASIEPEELKEMVKCIRNVEIALGKEEKKASPSERENLLVARKSIVAAKKIRKDEMFSEENITTKRPGTGLSPMKWNEVLGKAASKDYEMDEMIQI